MNLDITHGAALRVIADANQHSIPFSLVAENTVAGGPLQGVRLVTQSDDWSGSQLRITLELDGTWSAEIIDYPAPSAHLQQEESTHEHA